MKEEQNTTGLAAQESAPLSDSEMTVKEYNQGIRDVQLGIRDTMPDGTSLKEIHERNREALERQDQAMLDLEAERLKKKSTVETPDTAKPAEELDPDTTINVRTLHDGTTVPEVPASEEPAQDLTGGDTTDESDIPDDYPGRKQLIAAGHTDYAAVAGFTEEQLTGIKGIGPALRDKIVAFNESLKGDE